MNGLGLYAVLDMIVSASPSMREISVRRAASSHHAQVEDHPDL